jgi:hypothetical protein
MAGHFPFMGKGVRYGGARMTITAFYEQNGFNLDLQEKYYKWWFDWAKAFVEKDADLQHTKAVEFSNYPYGQHSFHSFHLNDKMWATALADLGDLVRDTILPKLDDTALHKLEEDHAAIVKKLQDEAKSNPREPAPDVGYFRHM